MWHAAWSDLWPYEASVQDSAVAWLPILYDQQQFFCLFFLTVELCVGGGVGDGELDCPQHSSGTCFI